MPNLGQALQTLVILVYVLHVHCAPDSLKAPH